MSDDSRRLMHRIVRHSRRVFIAIIGGLIIVVGVILIPYPGPGWLVVFAGFAVLSTEFEIASRTLAWLQAKYDNWVVWLTRQHVSVRILALVFTGLVVVMTAWLLNTFGLINGLLQLHQPWLISPFFR